MKKRLISAIAMIILAIPLLFIGKIYFKIFITILSMIGVIELLSINEKFKKEIIYTGLVSISTGILALTNINKVILLSSIIVLLLYSGLNKNREYTIKDVFYSCFAILFIAYPLYLFTIYRLDRLAIVVYLLSISILNDTMAYITGSLIGKRKFSTYSKNKTVEGSIGGIVGALIFSTTYYLTVLKPNANIANVLILTAILSVASQLGDLLFSMIKRDFKIKDYSNLIPGHGGILDRIDSVLVVTVVYEIINCLGVIC